MNSSCVHSRPDPGPESRCAQIRSGHLLLLLCVSVDVALFCRCVVESFLSRCANRKHTQSNKVYCNKFLLVLH